MTVQRIRTIPGDPEGRALEAVVEFGPDIAGALSDVRFGSYGRLAWAMVRVAAALAGPAEVVKNVSAVRLNISRGCVEVAAVVCEGQEVEEVQAALRAAVEAVPVSVPMSAAEHARVAMLRATSRETGPAAAERWQAPKEQAP